MIKSKKRLINAGIPSFQNLKVTQIIKGSIFLMDVHEKSLDTGRSFHYRSI
jgi:hypothetical protein